MSQENLAACLPRAGNRQRAHKFSRERVLAAPVFIFIAVTLSFRRAVRLIPASGSTTRRYAERNENIAMVKYEKSHYKVN